jgi:hypothetical protein
MREKETTRLHMDALCGRSDTRKAHQCKARVKFFAPCSSRVLDRPHRVSLPQQRESETAATSAFLDLCAYCTHFSLRDATNCTVQRP